METKCTICGTTTNASNDEQDRLGWSLFWCYAHRKGYEVSYPVCPKCSRHNGTFAVISAINHKADKESGRI